MKKIIMMAAAALLMAAPLAAENTPNTGMPSATENSPQVCQFSLSSYSGTINGGVTNPVTVGLSCPQQEDMYATVVVFIDNAHVASDVVKVPAGSTKSASFQIRVGSEYNGKSYRLVVQ